MGAVAVFAAQKGADAEMRAKLEAGMKVHLANTFFFCTHFLTQFAQEY